MIRGFNFSNQNSQWVKTHWEKCSTIWAAIEKKVRIPENTRKCNIYTILVIYVMNQAKLKHSELSITQHTPVDWSYSLIIQRKFKKHFRRKISNRNVKTKPPMKFSDTDVSTSHSEEFIWRCNRQERKDANMALHGLNHVQRRGSTIRNL